MSNTLPPNANLDWLRKQAKHRKAALRAQGDTTKLSEIQFQIAKENGFSSWRSLKAHFDTKGDALSSSVSAQEATAFLRAVGSGDLPSVKDALKRDPTLVNTVADHPFWGGRPQALHVSIESNQPEIFDLLLAAGADMNGSNSEYDHYSPLMLALLDDRVIMGEALIERGAKIGLFEALLMGNNDRVDTVLAQPDVLTLPCPSGSVVAFARTPYAVRRLIEQGVSTRDKNRWGSDAMDALSRLGRRGQPLIAALSECGEPVAAKDFARLGDLTRLQDMAKIDAKIVTDPAVFMAAVDFGEVDTAAWLLRNGANVNARQDYGSKGTALHSAAWNGDVNMVVHLLENGADPAALDEEHHTTPLVWAKTARKITNNARCDDVIDILSKLTGD